MNREEKNNILDQHKSIYNGFKTNYGMNSEQPLIVQDFANDKGGVTVNNKGTVDVYKNMNINEANEFASSKYVPEESFDFGGPDENMEEYVSMGEQKDMIGDGDDDLEHGTFDDDDINLWDVTLSDGLDDEDFDDEYDELSLSNEFDVFPKTKWSYDENIGIGIDDDLEEPLYEQLDKTLDMFKRMKIHL
jgi:hypothetical protein